MAGTSNTHWTARFRWPWLRSGQPPGDASAPPTISADGSTIFVGGFPVVRTFAHGALGELHLATDPTSGRPIALKTVRFQGSELTRERFLRESAAAVRLKHQHIVTTYAAGIDGSGRAARGWIAMEWVSGSDMSRYTQPSRLLPEPVVLEIIARVAEGLAHAHRHGVIHRDIKPSNILYTPGTSKVKVADFGCAHLSDAERSRSGLIIGTPVYMAPEQLAGVGVEARSDLYGLGVVMFQLLTGRLPFEGGNMGRMLTAIAMDPAPALGALRPDLPAALVALQARLLAKRPEQRPADGDTLARDIRTILSDCYDWAQRTDQGTLQNG
jgi:serine/threonine-protein kinase